MESNEKPDIFFVPRSPLLAKAEAFRDLLKQDNERLQQFLQNGGQKSQISMEEIDPNEESYIEMTIVPGIFELQGDMPQEAPNIDIPETEFHHASNYEGE